MIRMYDSRQDTLKHTYKVIELLNVLVGDLPEKAIFGEYTPKLSATTYGSDEYKQYLTEMQKGLEHHFLINTVKEYFEQAAAQDEE